MTRSGFPIALALSLLTNLLYGQSSSLYLQPQETASAAPTVSRDGQRGTLSVGVAQASFSAVAIPEPRKFQLHDLVTIIIRESISNDSSTKFSTSKETKVDGEISDFPHFNLADLLEARLKPGETSDGPKVGVKFKKEFDGDGSAKRTDTFTTRLTARIIDIKPNGTLVLEARKTMDSDGEVVTLVLTGVCRKDDVAADNTVLSTQMYDLHLTKETRGELRKATKKGILTKVLEGLFAF